MLKSLELTPALPAAELIAHAMDYMRANQRSVSFDAILRPSLWRTQEQMVESINRLATSADLSLPGLVEGRSLTGDHTPQDIATFYLDQGVRAVVIQLGPDGAYFRTSNSSGHVAAGYWVAARTLQTASDLAGLPLRRELPCFDCH